MNEYIQAIWRQFHHVDENHPNISIFKKILIRLYATIYLLVHDINKRSDVGNGYGYEYETDEIELAFLHFVPRHESCYFHQCVDWDVILYSHGKVFYYTTGCC